MQSFLLFLRIKEQNTHTINPIEFLTLFINYYLLVINWGSWHLDEVFRWEVNGVFSCHLNRVFSCRVNRVISCHLNGGGGGVRLRVTKAVT